MPKYNNIDKKMIPVQVTIRQDQAKWRRENPRVNLSGLLQEAIDKEMMRGKE